MINPLNFYMITLTGRKTLVSIKFVKLFRILKKADYTTLTSGIIWCSLEVILRMSSTFNPDCWRFHLGSCLHVSVILFYDLPLGVLLDIAVASI